LKLFRDIFREIEAFIKIMRFFEDIFREMEALIRNLRLFEDIFKRIEAFFLKWCKAFSKNSRLFKIILR
jgi:hypothetical protein